MNDSVRFYSTKVDPEKSLQEVAGLLRKYGAQRFEQRWEDNRTVAIRFTLPAPEARFGHLPIIMRPKVEHLARELRERHGIEDDDQVDRVAWRQLKGILEGILMAADSGMFSAAQILVGMAEDPMTGITLWEIACEQDELQPLLLQPGQDYEIVAEGDIA